MDETQGSALTSASRAPRRSQRTRTVPLGAALWLTGCASIPTIRLPPPQSAVAIEPIHIHGPHGALSARESRQILQRLNAQVGDADAFDRHLAIEQYVAGTPLYTGNRVTILRDGERTFAATFQAIRAARRYLYLEYYILQDVSGGGQRLGDLLIQRHRAGVRIDIIYDAIGSMSTPGAFFERLRAAGIHVLAYNPLPRSLLWINDRDHRKVLIADGDTAIIGGVNLSADYQSGLGNGGPDGSGAAEPAWHDVDLQVDGPAVAELKELFEQHWRRQGGSAEELSLAQDPPALQGTQVVRVIGSEGRQTTPRYYATLLSAIRTASTRIWIEAAYFVPTFQERAALERAARRNVDVRLLLPAHSDSNAVLAVQRSYYGALLRAGVKIYERDDGILHSKTAVMDGVWSIVGSSNFDHRSILFNDEVDAVVIGSQTGAQLEEYFLQDLQHARPIMLAQWRRRPFARKLRERFWRVWQQLL